MVIKKKFSLKELKKDYKKLNNQHLSFGLHKKWKIALGLTAGVIGGGVLYALLQRKKKLEEQERNAKTEQERQRIREEKEQLERQIEQAKEEALKKEKEQQIFQDRLREHNEEKARMEAELKTRIEEAEKARMEAEQKELQRKQKRAEQALQLKQKEAEQALQVKQEEQKKQLEENQLEEKQKEIISSVFKKLRESLENKTTIDDRIKTKNAMGNMLKGIQPCIEQSDDHLYLNKKLENNKYIKIVSFTKQIGSASGYGVAYLNQSQSAWYRGLKFSCKLMSYDIRGHHKQEIELLKKMTDLVLDKKTPNMPITYLSLECTHKCDYNLCPQNIKSSGYYVVINELADEDIQTWFKKDHNVSDYLSVILQGILSIYAFHKLGYIHDDCHLGNFLIHKIKPGGFWYYKIDDINIYIENTGYLLVLWDPGIANKYSREFIKPGNYNLDERYNNQFTKDYIRFLGLISIIPIDKTYIDRGLKLNNNNIIEFTRFLTRIFQTVILPRLNNEVKINDIDFEKKSLIVLMLDVISLKIPEILYDDRIKYIGKDLKPPGFVLNTKPFTM